MGAPPVPCPCRVTSHLANSLDDHHVARMMEDADVGWLSLIHSHPFTGMFQCGFLVLVHGHYSDLFYQKSSRDAE